MYNYITEPIINWKLVFKVFLFIESFYLVVGRLRKIMDKTKRK